MLFEEFGFTPTVVTAAKESIEAAGGPAGSVHTAASGSARPADTESDRGHDQLTPSVDPPIPSEVQSISEYQEDHHERST